jgi:hypothetical protein
LIGMLAALREMPMRLSTAAWAAIVALLAVLPGCAGESASRPMAQMQGDCADYRLDVARERALAQTQGVALAAAASAQVPLEPIPLEQKVAVGLLPQGQVQFRRAPERRAESSDRYGGLLVLRVPADGSYRIGTSTAAWIDVLTTAGASVRPSKFEMQKACKDVFKTVVFPLRADEVYTLQVSASRTQKLPVYVLAHPQK